MTSYHHWERLIKEFPLVNVGGVGGGVVISINVVKVSVRDVAKGTTSSLKEVINAGIQVQHIDSLLINLCMPNARQGKVKKG